MSPQTKAKVVVCTPGNNDVLCGRGGEIHARAGNKRYRAWVKERREAYSLSEKKEKKMIYAREVFDLVKSLKPPGRFLQKSNSDPSHWVEITEERALHKTSQALREGAPAIRAQAKQKQDILKKMSVLPQSRHMLQPMLPLYPSYGNYHQAPIPIPISSFNDATLSHRLSDVETILGRALQQQTPTDYYTGQILAGANTFYPNSRRTPSKIGSIGSIISKEALLKEIEILSKEVLDNMTNARKRSLSNDLLNDATLPLKKAKTTSEYAPPTTLRQNRYL